MWKQSKNCNPTRRIVISQGNSLFNRWITSDVDIASFKTKSQIPTKKLVRAGSTAPKKHLSAFSFWSVRHIMAVDSFNLTADISWAAGEETRVTVKRKGGTQKQTQLAADLDTRKREKLFPPVGVGLIVTFARWWQLVRWRVLGPTFRTRGGIYSLGQISPRS